MLNLQIYIYFNRPEINQLYAQIKGFVPTARVKKDSQTIEGGLSAGILGIGAKAGGTMEAGTEEQSETSEEHKLFEIKKHLSKNNQLLDEIAEAATYVLKNNVGIFVQSRYRFDAPQFRDSNDPIEAVNEAGCVVLECDVGTTKILVSLGLDHMPRVYHGHMGRTSHDAIIFREFGGKAIPLEIFGFLHPIGSKMQIRPITMSL